MAGVNENIALSLLKQRLNRLPTDTTLDSYLTARIRAAVGVLEGKGIGLTDSTDDLMLVVDYTAYEYSHRDKQTGEPDWLRLRLRERWLRQREP